MLGCMLMGSVSGENNMTIEYEASYIGVPLLDMTLTWMENDSTIAITYDNQLKPFIAFFHPIHNIYRVEFKRDSFEPLFWSKQIAEGELVFNLSASRSKDGTRVTYSNQEIRTWPEGCFTVFSATHMLASKANDPEFFPTRIQVLIDGELWEADVNRYTREAPHPDHKLTANTILIQADLHFLRGQAVMRETDILMDVIASEGTRFLLWVAPDGHYSKAQFGEFPKAVVLNQKD
jgi:hypothetical protein